MTKILNGKELSLIFIKKIHKKIKIWKNYTKITPNLFIILVGDHFSSLIYIKNKIIDCKNVGINHFLLKLPINITESNLLKEIEKANYNDKINGIIVQLPLPKHIDENKIISSINPKKDVDGFHPLNFGNLALGNPSFIPSTPLGILELIKHNKIKTSGKHVVIVGRSRIVGKPISIIMSNKNFNSTVTITHTYTKNIISHIIQADIIIAALGVPNFIKSNMIKKNSVIIDVGINYIKNVNNNKYKIIGDVDFKDVYRKVSYLTPVPGGIGPMTRVMLLNNTFLATKKQYH